MDAGLPLVGILLDQLIKGRHIEFWDRGDCECVCIRQQAPYLAFLYTVLLSQRLLSRSGMVELSHHQRFDSNTAFYVRWSLTGNVLAQ